MVDSFTRGVKPWDQKKKGSLDGTGYKREDTRCGREGTRGPSKQIRRTSRFLLDLLLDLSIYLSTLRRSWRASPIGTIERGDPLPFHSPPLSLSFLLPFFLSPWGAGNTEHGNVHTGPTREQPRPNGATELG